MIRNSQFGELWLKKKRFYGSSCFSLFNCLLTVKFVVERLTYEPSYKGGATSAKYRVGKVRFGGKEKDEVLATSRTAWDHSLRLISLEKNTTLSYYMSHRATVNSVEKSPVEENFFISASQDDSLRLWDLRTPSCQGFYSIPSSHATFDPLGVIIACVRSHPTSTYVN